MDRTKAEGWKGAMGPGAQGQDWLGGQELRRSSKENRPRLEMGTGDGSTPCWPARVFPAKGDVKPYT